MIINLKKVVPEGESIELIEFLAMNADISKSSIKKAISYGATWITKKGQKKRQRIRRIKSIILPGDLIEMFYDKIIIDQEIPEVFPVLETKKWGVWFKPAGVLSQGTKFGDHLSLLRLVEKRSNKNIFLVHRLDREASGLILLAYNKESAGKLSKLWQTHDVNKHYQVEVLGNILENLEESGNIDEPLDGKNAVSEYSLLEKKDKTCIVNVRIQTGRFHQIRRHFDMKGHPVMGDPKYGRNNKNKDGMKLLACKLAFKDPFSKEYKEVIVPKKYFLK